MTPEQKARVSVDALHFALGGHVCNKVDANFQRALVLRRVSLAKVFVADQ